MWIKQKKTAEASNLQRFILVICGPTWARTMDHLIMSQVL